MGGFRQNPSQVPLRLSVLLVSFLICSPWLHLASASCPTMASFSSVIGLPRTKNCTTILGAELHCAIECSKDPNCKLVSMPDCSEHGLCSCDYCTQLSGLNETATDSRVLLKLGLIAENTTGVDIPGGFTCGHPLLIKILPMDSETKLDFMTEADLALRIIFRFNDDIFETKTRIGGSWSNQSEDTPEFNFQLGQEISILIFLTSTNVFKIYVDGKFFRDHNRKVNALEIERVEMSGILPTSKIVEFYR